MSPIKMTLITAALGFIVASAVSALSLRLNVHQGNGGDQYAVSTAPAAQDPTVTWSQPGRSALYGSNLYLGTEPMVQVDEPLFDRTRGLCATPSHQGCPTGWTH
jgi:hypothetical protein